MPAKGTVIVSETRPKLNSTQGKKKKNWSTKLIIGSDIYPSVGNIYADD